MKNTSLIFFFIIFLLLNIFQAHGRTYDFTLNNSITLLEDPEQAAEFKIELIRSARHHIHIVTYYLDHTSFPMRVIEELKQAHQRGVEIRILSTYLPTKVKDPSLKIKTNMSLDDGGATYSFLLVRPGKNVLLVHNLHEKIFLVDGQKAVIGGRNLSDNAFRAKDIEAVLEGEVVDQVQDHFKFLFDKLVAREQHRCDESDYQECVQKLENQKFPNGAYYFPPKKIVGNTKARILTHDAMIDQMEHPLRFRQRMTQQDDIIEAVVGAEFQKMRAYNYFIMPTQRYQNFLYDSKAKGKSIQIMTNSLKSSAAISNKGYIYSLPTIKEFIEKGIKIYQWRSPMNQEYLHEKVIIFDDDHVFLGSHNFGTGSTSVSNEITVEFFSKEIGIELTKIFDQETLDSTKSMPTYVEQINFEIYRKRTLLFFLEDTFLGKILTESY